MALEVLRDQQELEALAAERAAVRDVRDQDRVSDTRQLALEARLGQSEAELAEARAALQAEAELLAAARADADTLRVCVSCCATHHYYIRHRACVSTCTHNLLYNLLHIYTRTTRNYYEY